MPPALSKEHGSSLVRVFELVDLRSAYATRILVAPKDAEGDVAVAPAGARIKSARFLSGATTLASEKPMTVPDAPDWDEIKAALKKNEVSTGDKLGGWPRFRQEPSRDQADSRLVLQLDDSSAPMQFLVQRSDKTEFLYFAIRG